MSENENALFGELVDYNQDRIETIRSRKWLDEVHGNGVPRMDRNQELLYCSVGLMSRSLGALTRSARATIVLDKGAEVRPGELPLDEGEGLVDAIMSHEQVIVLVTEDTKSEVVEIWNINFAILKE